MKQVKFNSLFGRRVLIIIAIGGLLALLLGLYYFVYAPHQQNYYNKSAFRILKSIAENFTQRVNGYDSASRKNLIDKRYKSDTIQNSLSAADFARLAKTVKQRINGKPTDIDTGIKLTNNSITQIMDPIVAIRNNVFEAIILSNDMHKDTGRIVYKSGTLDLDRDIYTDSIIKNRKGFVFPRITDITLEGVTYKLFLYPFRLNNEFYLLAGFIDNHEYQVSSNRFPLTYIFTIAILIVAVLLSVPILKIFLIGSYENISINDIRAIVAVLFITPVFFILFNWTIWIAKGEKQKSGTALAALHAEVIKNFYLEIEQNLKQLSYYDSLYSDTNYSFTRHEQKLGAIPTGKKVEFKDMLFYPANYKNMDVVFWMNARGEEITKWYFQKKKTLYINKSERQYFRDLDRNEGVRLPSGDTATFSIQPTPSLVTGEYTNNIVKRSYARYNEGDEDTPAYVGLSSKMYSAYQPVVPRGFNFCIINAAGEILYHSESNRNLQENIFSEVNNSRLLRQAISNRDSALIDHITLYEKDTKLIISPIKGLPYYLVTYSDKRNEYLFTRHVIAFSFLSESTVLLMLSLFVLYYYFANKRFSALFFSPHSLEWIKPNCNREDYYLLIIVYQVAISLILITFFYVVDRDQRFNYILNASMLLPFFVVIGYYLIRSAESNAILYREINEKHLLAVAQQQKKDSSLPGGESVDEIPQKTARYPRNYIVSILKIIIPYIFLMFLFNFVKVHLLAKEMIEEDKPLGNLLLFLKIIIPALGLVISLYRYHTLTSSGSIQNDACSQQKYAYMKYLLAGFVMSIILVSIIPTFGFIIYANKQELTLQLKSEQMHLAKKLQEHRKKINDKVDNYKFSFGSRKLTGEDEDYVKQMKFNTDYGLYLHGNVLGTTTTPLTNCSCCRDFSFYTFRAQVTPYLLRPLQEANNDALADITVPPADCSRCNDFENYTFYKAVTAYLFMPSDHEEYFKNTDDYYWKLCKTSDSTPPSLTLYYSNATDDRDFRDASALVLSSLVPDSLPFISELGFSDRSLQGISLVILIAALYLLIYYAAKRIFLTGYFEKSPGKEQDLGFINKIFHAVPVNESDKTFWSLNENTPKLTLDIIIDKENMYPTSSRQYDECILKLQLLLSRPYDRIWSSCSLPERSVLYDFALDGFTNYKNVNILYPLYQKGILRKENHHLVLMTGSFRNYLIAKSGSAEIGDLQKAVSEGGKWGNLSSILYILFFAIIIFLFIVQEEVSKRILAIVTSLGALIPILLKLFNTSGAKKTE